MCSVCNGYLGCPVCSETDSTYKTDCPECNGTGKITWGENDEEWELCELCDGTGRIDVEPDFNVWED